MENPMISRIQERLDALGKNAFEVAIAAGFDRTYVYEFLEGRKKSLRWNNIPRLAEQLDCDPKYLTGEINTPWPSGDEEGVDAGLPGSIQVSGMVSKDAWFREDFKLPTKITVAPDPRYPAATQRAFVVSGDTWRDHGIVDGSVVVTAPIEPREGDLLVAQVQRRSGEVQTIIGLRKGGEIRFEEQPKRSEKVEIAGVIVMENRTF